MATAMHMPSNEDFVDTLKSHLLNNEYIQRVSQTIGADPGKTREGIVAAAPALLAGIAARGATEPGARDIMNLVTVAQPADSMLTRLFGGRLPTLTHLLAGSTGLPTNSASALLATLVPTVMSLVGGKIRQTGWGIEDLMHFCSEQKQSILAALPPGFATLFASPGTLPFPGGSGGGLSAETTANRKSWVMPGIVVVGLLLVGLLLWNRRAETPMVAPAPPQLSQDLSRPAVVPPAVEDSTGTSSAAPVVGGPAAGVTGNDELSAFLAGPERVNLPHRIVFQELNFASGTTDLTEESLVTVRKLGETLLAHPNVHIVLEGHTDDTGSVAMNETLSENRARAVEGLLVEQGVDGTRIDTVGMGSSRPLEPNDTEAGREANRRIEVIVTKT